MQAAIDAAAPKKAPGRLRRFLQRAGLTAGLIFASMLPFSGIAKILYLYGNKIIFHKARSIEGAKFKRTPYGAYALRSQIKKDKKRFREKEMGSL